MRQERQQVGGAGGGDPRSLYHEYAGLSGLYRKQYGALTVVWMEVGTFYEFYNCDLNLGADVKGVCELTQLVRTRRNKSIPTISAENPEQAGFPITSKAKYLLPLLDAGYTVVIASSGQAAGDPTSGAPQPKGARAPRAVTQVISRSTYVGDDGGGVDGSANVWSTEDAGPQGGKRGTTLVAIYIDEVMMSIGCAAIDVTLGSSHVVQLDASTDRGSGGGGGALLLLFDAVAMFLATHQPSEVVVLGGSARSSLTCDEVRRRVNLPSVDGARIVVHDRLSNGATPSGASLRRTTDQEAMLRHVFPSHITGFLSPIEHVGLERRPDALVAYVAALQFAYDHDETIVRRLSPPDVADGSSHVSMSPVGALQQLDVIENPMSPFGCEGSVNGNGTTTLLRLLDKTCTPAGGRAFRRRLVCPTRDVAELRVRLDSVQSLMISSAHLGRTRLSLASTGDLERAFRRIAMGRFPASAVRHLVETQLPAAEACLVSARGAGWRTAACGTALHAVRALCLTLGGVLLDAADAAAVVVRGAGVNPFVRGLHPDIDAVQEEVCAIGLRFDTAAKHLSSCLPKKQQAALVTSTMAVRVDSVPGAAMVLVTTSRRLQTLKAAVPSASIPWQDVDIRLDDVEGVRLGNAVSTSASCQCRLVHPLLDAASNAVASATARMAQEVTRAYSAFLHDTFETHGESTMPEILRVMEHLDVEVACATNAIAMRHVRPRINEDEDEDEGEGEGGGGGGGGGGGEGRGEGGGGGGGGGGSEGDRDRPSVVAVGLRHPIIEGLTSADATPYVTNDVSLGSLLLFGVNAGGKSSLMKAIGLGVLMAQAGMFVAATEFRMRRPFSSICTRIGSRDDMFRGHSTFMVEMLELKAILARAARDGPRTLVIGDELCAGTESASALSIVGSAVRLLIERRAAFIFATHLHEITSVLLFPRETDPLTHRTGIPPRESLPRVAHMGMSLSDGRIVYERLLRPGQGPAVYGLEVCRGLAMDPAFIRGADAIRRQVLGVPPTLGPPPAGSGLDGAPRPSRYNSRVSLGGMCGMCGARPAAEVHHIVPQKEYASSSSSSSSSFPSPPNAPERGDMNRRSNLVPLCAACHDSVHAGRTSIAGYVQTTQGVQLHLLDQDVDDLL